VTLAASASNGERIAIRVHGVAAAVSGQAEAVQRLSRHFGPYLVAEACEPADLRVELVRRRPEPAALGRLAASQVYERGAVFQRGQHTFVDYQGRALGEYDFGAEAGRITSESVDDLVELGYLMLHSRLGELLEQRGLVRLHALGLCVHGQTAVVLAPSGGGKSSLARALLRHTDAMLLGDDMVLVDTDGQAHPFHTPLGVTDPAQAQGLGEAVPFPRRHHPGKWIVPLEAVAARLVHAPAPVDHVVLLTRVSAPPSELSAAGRSAGVAALARDMVVGLGLPQVIELVARGGLADLPARGPSLVRRGRAAVAVARRARFASLEAHEPEAAARALSDALR